MAFAFFSYEIIGCHHKSVANAEAWWVCPEPGGVAIPSDSLCVCGSDDLRTCGFHMGNVVESGIYSVKGFGGASFGAYLDVDTEMGKACCVASHRWRGVAWLGLAWRGMAWRGVAWRGAVLGGVA